MQRKFLSIVLYALPIAGMIGLIPLVRNDVTLTAIYVVCIAVLLSVRREKHDALALLFGFFGITLSEFFFVSTGVETFVRISFLGIMPLWLPFLWAYSFVTIKRSLRILD